MLTDNQRKQLEFWKGIIAKIEDGELPMYHGPSGLSWFIHLTDPAEAEAELARIAKALNADTPWTPDSGTYHEGVTATAPGGTSLYVWVDRPDKERRVDPRAERLAREVNGQ